MADGHAEQSKGPRTPLVVVWVAMGLYVVTFATMGILQYRAGNITYIDTANFEEMLWNTLRGRFLMSSQWPYTFLGRHVQFVHLFLLPVYVVYQDLRTLMVCQTVGLAAGALPVYALGVHVLKQRWSAALLAVAYLLYTPMQMLNLEGGGAYNTFRPITFAVPLLLAAFYYLVRGRLVVFSVFAALTLTCKEEFGLILVMVGLYAAVFHKRRAVGLAWAGVGLVWFAVSVFVVMRGIRGGEASHTMSYYAHLGDSWGGILAGVFLHPARTVELLLMPQKLEFYKILFLPVGFLCLLSPATLAMALPALGLCLLSSREAMWMPWFHYHAPIVPFVFVATVYGVRNLGRLARRLAHGREAAAGRLVAAASAFVLLCALGTNAVYSKSPLSFRFYDPKSPASWRNLYVATPHARQIPEAVRLVPRDAVVSASLFLATRFTHHRAVLPFPGGLEPEHWRPATYVVLDLKERWLFNPRDSRGVEQHRIYDAIRGSDAFEPVPAPEGFAIYRRVEPPNGT